MRRYKANVHNGGACTPAIMHWPAGITARPGSISPGRGHVVDLMATCLELAGASYPDTFGSHDILPHESHSLVPLLRGESGDRNHPYLFNHSNTHAVVKGDYKIVREGRGPWALYHLAKERTEITNLAEKHPEKVRELSKIWEVRWGRK
jgi:arylsulfatase